MTQLDGSYFYHQSSYPPLRAPSGEGSSYRVVLCEGPTLKSFGRQRWWWRIESRVNGQVVATSEVYSSKQKRDQTADRFAAALGAITLEWFG